MKNRGWENEIDGISIDVMDLNPPIELLIKRERERDERGRGEVRGEERGGDDSGMKWKGEEIP